MDKPLNKTQLKAKIATKVGLTSVQVGEVLDCLDVIALEELQTHNAFTLPGVIKLTKTVKPAVKGGVEKPNPFKKGEMMITKDKPEKVIIKARVPKTLKDSAQNSKNS